MEQFRKCLNRKWDHYLRGMSTVASRENNALSWSYDINWYNDIILIFSRLADKQRPFLCPANKAVESTNCCTNLECLKFITVSLSRGHGH